MIGFDLYDSEHTAVHVSNDASMAMFLHMGFVDNIQQGNGGAMSIVLEAKKTTMLHCEFTSNEATDGGGAIYHEQAQQDSATANNNNADLMVYRSFFHANHAMDDGAAVSSHANFTVSRSEFFSNTVSNADGPAIFDGSGSSSEDGISISCDAGENVACLNRDVVTDEACDGIYHDSAASCHGFHGSCETPSVHPSSVPIVSPNAHPAVMPSVSPSVSHVPISITSVTPSVFPSPAGMPGLGFTNPTRPPMSSPSPTNKGKGKGKGKGKERGKGERKSDRAGNNKAVVSHIHHDKNTVLPGAMLDSNGRRAMEMRRTAVRGGSQQNHFKSEKVTKAAGSSNLKARRGLYW